MVRWGDFTEEQQVFIRDEMAKSRQGEANRVHKYTIVLDKYEIDNLLWLFNCLGYKVFPEQESFRQEIYQSLNTGDWVGQIPQKLKKAIEAEHPYAHYDEYEWKPNIRSKTLQQAMVDYTIDRIKKDS